ncbi:MAG TPA: SurA N-terminal domain-containing protein [Dyella sp.]|uniref:SurA N-terminal domain-containing protein n=1 Tax=Dyella sp. TaxID=1869338 RepID=UPI002F95ED82
MLQALRNKLHGWPAILVLGICVFAVAFFGIESYFMGRTDTFVAKVNGQEISQQQFQDRLNSLRQQAAEAKSDTSVYEKPEMKQRIADAMIAQALLTQTSEKLGMQVPVSAVRDRIASLPYFQLNGQFDPTTYRNTLAAQGMTPSGFEAQVRSELKVQLLPDALVGSVVVTDADVDRFLNLQFQRRDLRFVSLPRATDVDGNVTDAQIDEYYKAHPADFMNPETVSLSYLEVNGADLKPETQASDEELKKRYEAEKQRFQKAEQRLVSHILINVPKNATPEQQKAALAKADKIAAEATPENFAKLAEQDSEDLGSKRQGGDLGWLEKGVANPAFDSALFALQKGQVSKPVLSPDEGYHIIYLRDVRAGDVKPFEEVRAQLAQEAAKAESDRLYNDVAGKLADKTYQSPSTLETAAQELKLPIKTTEAFSRQGLPTGLAANPKVVAAAFSDDVLAQGNNSSLIDLGGDHAVVIRVEKHVPAALRPLAQVSDDIRKRIVDERTAVAAKKHGDELLVRVQKGEDLQTVAGTAAVHTVADAQRFQDNVPPPVLAQAFKLPHPADGKPQYAVVQLPDGSVDLLAVDKVQGADMSKISAEERTALRDQMRQAYGSMQTQGLIDALKLSSDIKVAADRM